jgi:predicted nucleotidyltransferase
MPEGQERALPVSSSAPPEFAPEQRAMFVEVLSLFSAHRIPFAVSGAFALHQHTGIGRDTKDLDLFLAHADIPQALAALSADGFETEVCDPVWLCKARRGEFFVDLITGMSNAVITVERDWIERATNAEILGIPVKVLAAEELIASKVFVTRRERFDGADIVHVIFGTKGKLDWERILSLIGVHWMVLLWALVLYQYVYPAYSQFVPRTVWDDLLSRLRNELDHPDPNAPFRGSLIDENMFSIDVKEWGMANLNQQLRTVRAPLEIDTSEGKE